MDSTDLTAFCEDTVDDVYRYALRLTGGHPAHTADLVQDTYTALLRHASQYPTEPVRLPWLNPVLPAPPPRHQQETQPAPEQPRTFLATSSVGR